MIDEQSVRFVGAIVGFISLSLAIYFQMISRMKCPWRYVAYFASAGIFLIFINADAVGVERNRAVALELALYLGILIVELVASYKLWKMLNSQDYVEWPDGLPHP